MNLGAPPRPPPSTRKTSAGERSTALVIQQTGGSIAESAGSVTSVNPQRLP